ncbi:unnamed protein product [Cuscuta campestris]|uniref:Reverse transcriptase domain-containing protein n=1 Tax=Cuscuta campestris TaxID=132261 RepID=A0A484MZC6_9ASTE|nr:unnamed protein product [Cuscuta campestris]
MLASKVGKPLRTDLVTKQLGKSGFCRVLVEVDFSKEPVTSFEEDPKYCFHCKTWNHGPFHCRSLELKKNLEANVAQKGKDTPSSRKEWVASGSRLGAYSEPIGGLIPSSSNKPNEHAKEPLIGTGVLNNGPNYKKQVGDTDLGLKKKKTADGNMVGKRQEGKKVRCLTTQKEFCLTFIYGLYTVTIRRALWDKLFSFADNMTKPWALLGDFNCVLASNERVNCMSQGAYYLTDLQNFKSFNCLEDVPSKGLFYTWHKGNKLAKLDRVFINQEWADIGWAPTCDFMDFNHLSDHSPMLLYCGSPPVGRSKPFKFFNMWIKHEDFQGLVTQSWGTRVNGSKQFSLCSKLKRLKPPLKTLNKNAFGHISRRAMEAKEEYRLIMKEVMADPNNQALVDDAETKRKRANFLLDAELEFYQQKAKCDFLMKSDRGTSYFHSLVKKNRKKHVIPFLIKDDGTKTTSSNEVVGCFLEFYQNLFGTTPQVGPIVDEVLAAGATVPESAHSRLLAMVTLEEVKDVVFDIDYAIRRSTPSCMIKLDITKAYDTVSWRFLEDVMLALGFPSRFVALVMECVTSASSSIMVNGDSHGFFKSKRGLRQGDPMAPTLFLFCIEYFSRLLNIKTKEGTFNYHKDCANLGITHLAFADDLMLFSRGDLPSVQVLMDCLEHFSSVSGLVLSPTKSNIFLAGKYRDTSHDILGLVSFPRGQLPVRYLGLPLASHRISEADYAPLFKTVEGFLSKWKTMKISYAGKLELIRAVIQGVQSFWLQAFPVQKYVRDRITSHCRDFLWGSKFAKVAWSDICKPKIEGGLGLKDAGNWNDALLCKHLWNLAAKKDSLWVRWVHSVYIKDADFWQWQPKKRHSVFFKRLAYVRELLVQKLGDHNSSMEVALQPYCLGSNLVPSKVYDLLRVKANPKPWMAFIWHSTVPPKCSFTMWLAFRRRLPTKTNLEFLGIPLDCTLCGQAQEDVDHLFFGCNVSQQVWGTIKHWLRIDGHLSTLDRAVRWMKSFRRGDAIMKKTRKIALACTVFHIWKQRNATHFDQEPLCIEAIICKIKVMLVVNYEMHELDKPLPELLKMLQTAKESLTKGKGNSVLLVQGGKGKKKFKKAKKNGPKGKSNTEPKSNSSKLKPKGGVAKDSICHHCGEVGH